MHCSSVASSTASSAAACAASAASSAAIAARCATASLSEGSAVLLALDDKAVAISSACCCSCRKARSLAAVVSTDSFTNFIVNCTRVSSSLAAVHSSFAAA